MNGATDTQQAARPRLHEKYLREVVPAVRERFGITNDLAVPRLDKIVINMGVGAAIQDIKILDKAMEELALITGQRPIVRRAKRAVSNFKLRIGMPIGCMVTLRKARMYEFFDRLVNICLPRIRDFNGVSRKSFDREGHYSLGIKDQAIFPEIDTGKITRTQGMDITFVFNKGPREQTEMVLERLGMPFARG